ncbi:hypothetical protein [uncultured Roseovarius sp.]|uniref:hypothetical protein n=1 Tax=uncultured Roseovarius sp. TaxID=293344 RepID=UPI002613E672|nr:hypothetical protein [uncultured Roseovarius sp.]
MAKHKIVHAAAASGLTLCILPALAEENQGVVMTFDFEQRFEAGDNIALENPEEGNTTLSTTSLTFGLTTETHNQSLSVLAGAKLRAGEIPSGSDIETGFVEPRISFSYMREAANSVLDLDGSYRQSDISFQPAVSDFADDDGVIVLPPDFEDLEGSGTRRNYNLNASLEIGREAPLGFVFTASTSGISYDQQTAALSDIERYSAGIRSNFRFSDVTTAFAVFNYDHYEADDIQSTERNTNAVEVGVAQELSERFRFEAAIGFSETEETLFRVLDTTTSGVTGRATLSYDMPNGVITGNYATTRDQDGARHNVSVGRSYELPRGEIAVSVGATSKDSGDPALIGSVDYMQDLATGNFKVGINRNVSISNEDEERITTTAVMGYNHDINNISSLGLDFSYGLSEGNSTADETLRTDVSASYNRDVTEDWKISTGVSYRVRDQDTSGKSDSTSIFVTLKREFDFFR